MYNAHDHAGSWGPPWQTRVDQVEGRRRARLWALKNPETDVKSCRFMRATLWSPKAWQTRAVQGKRRARLKRQNPQITRGRSPYTPICSSFSPGTLFQHRQKRTQMINWHTRLNPPLRQSTKQKQGGPTLLRQSTTPVGFIVLCRFVAPTWCKQQAKTKPLCLWLLSNV